EYRPRQGEKASAISARQDYSPPIRMDVILHASPLRPDCFLRSIRVQACGQPPARAQPRPGGTPVAPVANLPELYSSRPLLAAGLRPARRPAPLGSQRAARFRRAT